VPAGAGQADREQRVLRAGTCVGAPEDLQAEALPPEALSRGEIARRACDPQVRARRNHWSRVLL
jgi:hypothetical protein